MSYFFSRFLRLLFIIILLGLSFVLVSDHLAQYLVSATFNKLEAGKLTFSIDRLTLSKVVIKDIELADSQGTTLGIGQLAFNYRLSDLFQKKVHIPTLSIKQSRLTIQQKNDTWHLGGTFDALALFKPAETKARTASTFKVDIDHLEISNSQLIFDLPGNQGLSVPFQLEASIEENEITAEGMLHFMGQQNHFSASYDTAGQKSILSFTSALYPLADMQSFFVLPETLFLKGLINSEVKLSLSLQPLRLETLELQVFANQAAMQLDTVKLTQLPMKKSANNNLLLKADYRDEQLELQLCPWHLESTPNGILSNLNITLKKPLLPPPYEGTIGFQFGPEEERPTSFAFETKQQLLYSFHPVKTNEWNLFIRSDEKNASSQKINMSFGDTKIQMGAAFRLESSQNNKGLFSQISSDLSVQLSNAACQSASSNCLKLSAPKIDMNAKLGRNSAEADDLNGFIALESGAISVDLFNNSREKENKHQLSIGSLAMKLPFSSSGKTRDLKSEPAQGSLFAGTINIDQYQIGDLKGTLVQQKRQITFEGFHENQLFDGMPVQFNAAMTLDPANKINLDFGAHAPEFSQLLVLGQYVPQLSGYLLKGQTSLDFRAQMHDHMLTGPSLLISLKNGTLTNTKKKFSLKNINTVLELPKFTNPYSYKTQLTFDELTFNQLKLKNGRIVYNLDHPQTLYVDKIAADWASGRIESQAFAMPQFRLPEAITFYCSRLSLQQVFHQFGIENFGGDGTVSGNIPIQLGKKMMSFDNAFLYSTPGIGGTLKLYDSQFLLQGVPPGTVQFHQMDFASEALRNFQYNWVKLSLNSTGDDAELKMLVEGEPEHPIPFEYNKEIGAFTRMKVQSKGGIKHPILLETNFHLPLGQMLRYGKSINKILN